jgi:hypothetical protein
MPSSNSSAVCHYEHVTYFSAVCHYEHVTYLYSENPCFFTSSRCFTQSAPLQRAWHDIKCNRPWTSCLWLGDTLVRTDTYLTEYKFKISALIQSFQLLLDKFYEELKIKDNTALDWTNYMLEIHCWTIQYLLVVARVKTARLTKMSEIGWKGPHKLLGFKGMKNCINGCVINMLHSVDVVWISISDGFKAVWGPLNC